MKSVVTIKYYVLQWLPIELGDTVKNRIFHLMVIATTSEKCIKIWLVAEMKRL